MDRRTRLRSARLYLVCDAIASARLEAALRGGVDIVQLRIKDGTDAEILEAAGRFAPLCAAHGALLVINDRPDLAVHAGADGVHVGQEDTPVQAARDLVGPELLVGLSTRAPGQIEAAREPAVDYIGVGPVYSTPTKPDRAAVGTDLVSYAAAHAAVPFFAIGGIDPGNVAAVAAAGGGRGGVAVVRAITEAADPESAARGLRAGLGAAPGDGPQRQEAQAAGGAA